MKKTISLNDFIAFCSGNYRKITLTRREWAYISETRKIWEDLAAKQQVYGFNTGIGPFFKEYIPPELQAEFQRNMLLRHAAGVGEFLSDEEARGMMFLLINMLRRGYSCISLETLERLIDIFNSNIVPIPGMRIPEHGSVGASGDLAPQAHLARFLVAIGYCELKPGEALALLNGTHFMTSLLARTVYCSDVLAKTADVAAALTILALKGNLEALDSRLHALRLHPEQSRAARNIKRLFGEADFSAQALQDSYSLRCTAQVHGPVNEAIDQARRVVEREINSITCNPVLIADEIIHGGNFHGQILAMQADFLAIALATLANISERRIDRLLNGQLSGLPQFLSQCPGLDSGLMIAQYTAADLCAENKILSHPASVDSIPLAAGQEDFVSMGAGAVRKARKVCSNAAKVLAIELLCAVRALDLLNFSGPEEFPLTRIYKTIKSHNITGNGVTLSEQIQATVKLVEYGIVAQDAERAVEKSRRHI